MGSRRNNSTLGAGNQLAAAEFSNFNINVDQYSIHNIGRKHLLCLCPLRIFDLFMRDFQTSVLFSDREICGSTIR